MQYGSTGIRCSPWHNLDKVQREFYQQLQFLWMEGLFKLLKSLCRDFSMLHWVFFFPYMYMKSLCAKAHAQAWEKDAFIEMAADK